MRQSTDTTDLFGVSVRPHRRRRPKQIDKDLLLADCLSLLSTLGAPRSEDKARRYYGVRKRLREHVQ